MSKTQSMKKDIQTLVKASRTVAQQFTNLRANAESHQALKDNPAIHPVILNALILSFAVNFRNIYDFLFSTPTNPKDDVLAAQFFDEPQTWHQLRPEISQSLRTHRGRLNKHLAHITYARVNQSQADLFWDFQEVMEGLTPAIKLFVNNVDPCRIHSDMLEELTNKVWKTMLLNTVDDSIL
ncbi:hypothetical protein [Bdellovibrio bacteriovorus]|uniref:hypothetical protein n=1 Tax=Bdellovibrio bacteriovorus TaxID=959 RepID=UPI0035A64FC2